MSSWRFLGGLTQLYQHNCSGEMKDTLHHKPRNLYDPYTHSRGEPIHLLAQQFFQSRMPTLLSFSQGENVLPWHTLGRES